jgi:hypothetical protein
MEIDASLLSLASEAEDDGDKMNQLIEPNFP